MMRRVFVVTGGNRGIGLEIVKQLSASLDASSTILIGCRDEKKGQEGARAAALEREGRPSIRALQLDTANPASVRSFASSVRQEYGRVDVLINNAGVYENNGWNRAEFDRIISTNVHGPVELSLELLPLMYAAGAGRIVSMSSGLGRYSQQHKIVRELLNPRKLPEARSLAKCEPFLSLDEIASLSFDSFSPVRDAEDWRTLYKPCYSISKCLLNIATVALQQKADREFNDQKPGEEGISVFSVDPGWCRTDMGGESAPRSAGQGADTASFLALLPGSDPRLREFRGHCIKDRVRKHEL